MTLNYDIWVNIAHFLKGKSRQRLSWCSKEFRQNMISAHVYLIKRETNRLLRFLVPFKNSTTEKFLIDFEKVQKQWESQIQNDLFTTLVDVNTSLLFGVLALLHRVEMCHLFFRFSVEIETNFDNLNLYLFMLSRCENLFGYTNSMCSDFLSFFNQPNHIILQYVKDVYKLEFLSFYCSYSNDGTFKKLIQLHSMIFGYYKPFFCKINHRSPLFIVHNNQLTQLDELDSSPIKVFPESVRTNFALCEQTTNAEISRCLRFLSVSDIIRKKKLIKSGRSVSSLLLPQSAKLETLNLSILNHFSLILNDLGLAKIENRDHLSLLYSSFELKQVALCLSQDLYTTSEIFDFLVKLKPFEQTQFKLLNFLNSNDFATIKIFFPPRNLLRIASMFIKSDLPSGKIEFFCRNCIPLYHFLSHDSRDHVIHQKSSNERDHEDVLILFNLLVLSDQDLVKMNNFICSLRCSKFKILSIKNQLTDIFLVNKFTTFEMTDEFLSKLMQ